MSWVPAPPRALGLRPLKSGFKAREQARVAATALALLAPGGYACAPSRTVEEGVTSRSSAAEHGADSKGELAGNEADAASGATGHPEPAEAASASTGADDASATAPTTAGASQADESATSTSTASAGDAASAGNDATAAANNTALGDDTPVGDETASAGEETGGAPETLETDGGTAERGAYECGAATATSLLLGAAGVNCGRTTDTEPAPETCIAQALTQGRGAFSYGYRTIPAGFGFWLDHLVVTRTGQLYQVADIPGTGSVTVRDCGPYTALTFEACADAEELTLCELEPFDGALLCDRFDDVGVCPEPAALPDLVTPGGDCTTPADCALGLTCVGDAPGGRRQCLEPCVEDECAAPAHCVELPEASVNRACLAPCSADADCTQGSCVSGADGAGPAAYCL